MRDVYRILERNAKASPEEIAAQTELSVEEVRQLISKAEGNRIILRYKSVINWEKLGEEQVWALVEVSVTPQRDLGFDATAQSIARFPEVRFLYVVSGDYDLSVLVVGKTIQEVASFVTLKLAAMEHVRGTATHFLLKRFKEDGEILAEVEEGVKRLPLSP